MNQDELDEFREALGLPPLDQKDDSRLKAETNKSGNLYAKRGSRSDSSQKTEKSNFREQAGTNFAERDTFFDRKETSKKSMAEREQIIDSVMNKGELYDRLNRDRRFLHQPKEENKSIFEDQKRLRSKEDLIEETSGLLKEAQRSAQSRRMADQEYQRDKGVYRLNSNKRKKTRMEEIAEARKRSEYARNQQKEDSILDGSLMRVSQQQDDLIFQDMERKRMIRENEIKRERENQLEILRRRKRDRY